MSDLLELDDIRLAWVDNPKSDCFQSHRSLKRYALELHNYLSYEGVQPII